MEMACLREAIGKQKYAWKVGNGKYTCDPVSKLLYHVVGMRPALYALTCDERQGGRW